VFCRNDWWNGIMLHEFCMSLYVYI
jgi:hypothetical protein